MMYRVLADAIVLLHVLFIAFALFGGLFVLRWTRAVWLHLPTVVWVAFVEFTGWICPLTPLENHLRNASDHGRYHGGFIEHYLEAIIYPNWLTRDIQMLLGGIAIGLNVLIYFYVWKQKSKKRNPH